MMIVWLIYVSRRLIALRNFHEKEPGNIAFGLTTSGASVLNGLIIMPTMSKLQIIIEGMDYE
ncbi:MAG: hypothetical protein A2Z28_01390 [Chloroflexi bacterium RBG_16_51_9]|nr:MAG: hypothetical protein A2Z28_01390 [Chloroflexi bacterium RBG_16_51_9]